MEPTLTHHHFKFTFLLWIAIRFMLALVSYSNHSTSHLHIIRCLALRSVLIEWTSHTLCTTVFIDEREYATQTYMSNFKCSIRCAHSPIVEKDNLKTGGCRRRYQSTGKCYTCKKTKHFNVSFVMRQWSLAGVAPIVLFPHTFLD